MKKTYVPLNWIQWLTLLLLLATAIVTPIVFARIQNVQDHQNDALRSIMCHAERVVERTPASATFTAKQKTQALRFYRSSLADARLEPCR